MTLSLSIPITDESQVGHARRTAVALAQEQGLSETEAGKLAIIVSEAARNQLRYARDGLILLRKLVDGGVEMLALDKGPGLTDLAVSFQDGHSTGGTSGTGLGAMRRLASSFDIFSHPGSGTAILAQCRAEEPPTPQLLTGAVNLPIHGERVCGDTWTSGVRDGKQIFMVCDGLGHGPLAAEASAAALAGFDRALRAVTYAGPGQILEMAHKGMLSTRGAAIAVAELDLDRQVVRFAGIGNIGASLYSPQAEKKMASLSGIVGAEMRKISEFSFPWTANTLLVMHSDGLQSQWNISRYPGLFTRHPSLIAGVLFRDFQRGRDDVTVLVAGQP